MPKNVITLELNAKENLNLIIAVRREPCGKILIDVQMKCITLKL